jgi:hypothetical protein
MKNLTWWIVEIVVWYLFFYAIIFIIKNDVNIGWMAFILLLLGSFGLFASPLTRHLSLWNKILDKVVRKSDGEDDIN